ncbi:DUF2891 domain-containing protein [Polymorphobacter fuscus]|uniref:DUF2891 family protein n=1 Tax=Sandarakinorhabdus fusca TaxID=1439888 RepID=A0A7C9GPI8_9SPHN|nr:DUF2891 domain-containing protein [Polymorphobacter fuscus]KAB7646348.1 DUF2891 domain-containing protein [Polymorphobacter fuscus]MQT17575.1 DUF2891 family protein [Polymorphobacter fuscus]NJC09882.1 hypothetical protein [Polymorphobacter fuscus]
MILDELSAATLARIALGHVTREYPHKLDHVMDGPGDARTPRDLHPMFFGSFDWHSCVHGWWLLLRLLRRFPGHAAAGDTRALAAEILTADHAAAELAYLAAPSSRGFERPYGWAWLLALHAEAARHDDPRFAKVLAPLATAFAERTRAYLPQLTYPIRTGSHGNTGFALVLMADWARDHDPELLTLMAVRARDWFGRDRDAQVFEPDGDAFLSPTLTAALAMATLLPPAEFRAWFAAYLPDVARQAPASLFTPARVSDRSDGKIAHLDGLNLSRAWCWTGIAGRLEGDDGVIRGTARVHLEAGLPHIAGDYAGEHWLATFALLALEGL